MPARCSQNGAHCELNTVFNLTSVLFGNLLMFADVSERSHSLSHSHVPFFRLVVVVVSIFADSLFFVPAHIMFQRCNPINYSELLVFIYLHRYILIAISHIHTHTHSYIYTELSQKL